MLRLFITLLLLVGAALAESHNAWKDGKEYTYKIKSRTLASFNSKANQFSGIVMEGQLTIQPSGPETLRAKISEARYSSIHTLLENGWESEIPTNKESMQNFPLSDKPFEIKIKKGVVTDLIVDKDAPTWQVNVLKSIVGQLQVDTQGVNAEKSKQNQLPEGKKPNAMYTTMEDSVGGKCEVLYDVSPLSENMLQNNPELAPMPELREDGEMISIVKSKNYSNCDQRVSYHFGLNGRNNWKPGSNENGKFLSRSSVSRIVISGNVKKYTIQSSITSNKVVLNSDQRENHQGMISSKIELRLQEFKDIGDKLPAPSNPESTGNLVYNYDSPFEKRSSRHLSDSKSHEKNKKHKEHWRDNEDSYEISSDSIYSEEETNDSELEPELTEPPRDPDLSIFTSHNGHSSKTNNKVDVVKSAKSIAREMGNEMLRYDSMPEEDTLEKFTILSKLIRIMNAKEIEDVQSELYEPPRPTNEPGPARPEQKARRNTWAIFRDAVAQSGTGPALINIKKWIQEEKIKDDEAAKVIDAIAKSTHTPTPKYLETFLEMLKLKQVIDPPVVYDNAHQSYADLVRHAVVNKKSAHNRYSDYAEKFYGKNIHDLHAKYFPYMASELQDAFDKKDSIKIQVLVSAIGRTGHPRMLSLFEPYIEGKKEATPYERFLMVISMYRLATTYPKTARSVFYKIYSNTADNHETRTAAVYLLMKTNPPASMLQRMADFTNYDSNKHVNSAVKSTIESLSKLQQNNGNRDLANAASAALPLLTKEVYGPQYSRAFFANHKNPTTQTGFSLEAYYIGSDDSIIPKGVSVSISPVHNGLKMPKIQMAGAVSKIQDLYDSLQTQLGKKAKNNDRAEQKKYSPENIAKLLGINGDKPELLEGFMSFTDAGNTRFFAYTDKETGNTGDQLDNLLSDIPEKLRRLQKNLKKGVNFDETSMMNQEVIMSFPTETGYPLTFTLKAPSVSKLIGQAKAQIEPDSDNQSPIPDSATVTAKVHLILGTKVQKRLAFLTPFENQEYISGVDKSVQFHFPIKAEIEYNKNKQEARLKVQPNNEEPQFKIIQMKTEPFTSKHDLLSLKPVSNDINTRIINKDVTLPLQVELSDNKQSLRFNWERIENQYIREFGSEALKRGMAISAAKRLFRSAGSMHSANQPGEETEYEKYSINLSPDTDMSIEMKFSFDSLVIDSNQNNKDSSEDKFEKPKGKAPSLDLNMNEVERKQKLLTEAAKNIDSVEASAVDVSFKLNGDLQISGTFTAAIAMSDIDEKYRTLIYTSVKIPDGEDYFVSAGFEGKSPHFRTMDFEETLKANNHHEFDGEIKSGKKSFEEESEVIKFNGKIRKSEKSKNEIRQSREAQECNKEASRTGNKLTPACQRVNERAVVINAGDFSITYEAGTLMEAVANNALTNAQMAAITRVGSRIDRDEKSENNTIKLTFEISPEEESIDISITSPDGTVIVPNIKLPSSPRDQYENIKSDKELESFQTVMSPFATCALDKTEARTFDNHRYNLQLGQCWHVVMTPFPKKDYFRPGHSKKIPEDEHVTILTRENEDGNKEFKITLGDKEIELLSRGDRKVEVKIDGKKIKLSKKHGHQESKNKEIILEIFEVTDKSVKVISEKYEVRIIYDGSRAIIKTGDKYRDAVRGLCGNNDGEPDNDQQTPKGCLLEKSEEFTATYALVNEEQCRGPARENAEKAKQSECTFEKDRPGNVISDKESGRKQHSSSNESSSSEESDDSSEDPSCTKRRTMVLRSDSEICFSVKPVPKCASGCHSTGKKNKSIDFHCVHKSSTSERVAERVEKGANPDLTQKKVSKTETHKIPTGCKA